jgi:hypothetical protein
MGEIQDMLLVPLNSPGEAVDWAGVSAATLGEDSPVTAQFSELATELAEAEAAAKAAREAAEAAAADELYVETQPEAAVKREIVVEVVGKEARLIRDGLVEQIKGIPLVPPPDEATQRRFKKLRHLLFQSDYQRVDKKAA